MPSHALLILADDLFHRRLAESDLPDATAHIPVLDEETVHTLIQQADQASRTRPRYGWAMMRVIDAAANHTAPPFLQALTAWHLGRLANEYGLFPQARQTLARARHLFSTLNEPVWLALCTWQENLLSWVSPNLSQSIIHLQNALADLENAGAPFALYLPQCHLTLATFQLMAGDLASAETHIAKCENTFRTHQDGFNLGRCLLAKTNIARRTGQIESAVAWLDEAKTWVAEWPGEKAKISLQQGYLQWLNQGDYAGAITTFMEVIQVFTTLDMPVWAAQAQDGLAQVYTITGNLREAERLLKQALDQATAYEATSLRVAILLDMGWFYAQRGDPEQSLSHLQSAAHLSEPTGSPIMQAIILMHLGDACIQLGRYQLALRYLEKSYDRFKQLGNISRLAECELRLAQTWLSLGQAQMSQLYLTQASDKARQASHPTLWPYLSYGRALTYLQQEQPDSARTALEEGLQTAQQQSDPHSIAMMQRGLATLLLSLHQPYEAYPHLTSATDSFRAMNMAYAELDCFIPWGQYHILNGDQDQARQAWEQALEQSLNLMPDISWLAADGLARLAEERGDPPTALRHYHQMREALSQIRRGFWQPELANSFNQRPSDSLDRAVHLAVRVGTAQDVLAFIEENKAHLITRQMHNHMTSTSSVSVELQAQLGQIRWLQEKLRTTSPAQFRWQPHPLRQQLKELVEAYTDARNRWQRAQTDEPEELLGISFDQDRFRQKANLVLGQEWVALDYYLTDQQLQAVVITPTNSYTWAKKMTGKVERALLDMMRYGWEAEEDEAYSPLDVLGQFLFPEAVTQQLTATTTLIIAPHRRLHFVPWSALWVRNKPLVALCVPTLVLSLTNLMTLWSRPRPHSSPPTTGLLLALSNFPDYRTPLPEVVEECAIVRPRLGIEGLALCEDKATWDNFLVLAQEQGLARFSFWHVASHAFHEPITGQLSGLSFYDRDVWLDELWQCAPLPQLVTLSACSGSKSKLYAGDEHISLAATCLSAGAHTVVGSLWPVPDKEMPALMHTYYAALAVGKQPALALASAQRLAWEQGKSWRMWGGFSCTGSPV